MCLCSDSRATLGFSFSFRSHAIFAAQDRVADINFSFGNRILTSVTLVLTNRIKSFPFYSFNNSDMGMSDLEPVPELYQSGCKECQHDESEFTDEQSISEAEPETYSAGHNSDSTADEADTTSDMLEGQDIKAISVAEEFETRRAAKKEFSKMMKYWRRPTFKTIRLTSSKLEVSLQLVSLIGSQRTLVWQCRAQRVSDKHSSIVCVAMIWTPSRVTEWKIPEG